MAEKIFKSARFFTQEEFQEFKKRHGYEVTEISYACNKEIDFSQPEEKEFLMREGFPMILARFFA